MQTAILYEFSVKVIPDLLKQEFGSKNILRPPSNGEFIDEAASSMCPGCKHDTFYLYVASKDHRGALMLLNDNEGGLCANCMANLIADRTWELHGQNIY